MVFEVGDNPLQLLYVEKSRTNGLRAIDEA